MEEQKRIPRHVSIIMDGNGRWAEERGKERVYGHAAGVESVRACTEAAVENGVEYLSLFAFSEENWNRPEHEVHTLMELMVKAMKEELPVMMKNRVRFVVLGNRSRLSDSLNEMIDDCMAQTSENDRLVLVIFLSYSGKWDMLQAAKRLALDLEADPGRRQEILDMGTDDFGKYLVTADIPDPDLIIRTSGECRLSNFLLWQAAYSEFLFTDVLWPDFRKPEFRAALDEYAHRDRRFGRVKQQ